LRILLTGRRGQVGWELERALAALAEVFPIDRTTLDLADPDAIRRIVRNAKPDVIVNAAAYTAVDKAESEPELATRVNATAPGVLAEEAKRLGVLLVHYSTDYVFDGGKRSPYTEDDAPNPLSHYGRTKLQGEQAIAASGCRYLTIRTSWVYSPRATNFYRIILGKAQANEPMRMVDDQTSVPTPAAFVGMETTTLLRQKASGLVHVVPSGEATRYEFAREVVRAVKSASSVQPARTSEFPAPARRPVYSVLDNRRMAAIAGSALPDWKSLLPNFLREFGGSSKGCDEGGTDTVA
jgi:dTDP-4-dehydrorhamnose reductase